VNFKSLLHNAGTSPLADHAIDPLQDEGLAALAAGCLQLEKLFIMMHGTRRVAQVAAARRLF
jgi:hypothetical protein